MGDRDHRIVVGYRNEQEGRNIDEDQVIRAEGFFHTSEEVDRFSERSNARCPTHGNCERCYKAGPVGLRCVCGGGAYKVIMAHERNDDMRRRRIVDAEKLAELLGKDVQIAQADRRFNWVSTPTEVLKAQDLRIMAMEKIRPEMARVQQDLHRQIFGLWVGGYVRERRLRFLREWRVGARLVARRVGGMMPRAEHWWRRSSQESWVMNWRKEGVRDRSKASGGLTKLKGPWR